MSNNLFYTIEFIANCIIIVAGLMFLLKAIYKMITPSTEAKVPILRICINGNGRTYPAPSDYRCRLNIRKRVGVSQGILDYWDLDGTKMGRNSSIVVLMNDNHTLTAVFASEEKE